MKMYHNQHPSFKINLFVTKLFSLKAELLRLTSFSASDLEVEARPDDDTRKPGNFSCPSDCNHATASVRHHDTVHNVAHDDPGQGCRVAAAVVHCHKRPRVCSQTLGGGPWVEDWADSHTV